VPRLAVFGGVYANPHALRAVLADAAARGCDERHCLGDLGGFGAECDAVWPLLLEHDVQCIAGNYDLAIGRGDEDCGCGYASERDNHFAQVMYDHTLAATSREFAAWMTTLADERRVDLDGVDVLMVHGSPLAVNDFLWESLDDDELRVRLDAVDGGRPDVLLCTHTGIAWQRTVDDTLIVNVGAVGRPQNDGRREVWYAVLDVEGGTVRAQLVPVAYDWRAQAASMRAAGLPEAFVETVETGWWTTCLEVVPPPERARGRFHVYRDAMPAPAELADGAGWADTPDADDDGRPVVSLFGTPLFPPRLWLYTNFHCNLACDYCVVASSPTARRRQLDAGRFRELVDEAVAEGFAELYLTGGEPFLHPEIETLVRYAAERLPTVVLTNAMLFTGRRREALAALADLPDLVVQSSIDGSTAALHDAWRGAGSFRRAMDGLAYARELGLPLRVAMTQTPENADDVPALRAALADVGITGDDFAVRPLIARGFAAGTDGDDGAGAGAGGMAVSDSVLVPELTITTDGAHWHPIGADVQASPDFLVATGAVPLADAKQAIVRRFLELRQADGTLPEAYHCAI
jgi:pyruvate-formate lyase-activating enzyme/diadenosine tetraphosphatase ApaH/serine/threonine PP2A family protein phosphatase